MLLLLLAHADPLLVYLLEASLIYNTILFLYLVQYYFMYEGSHNITYYIKYETPFNYFTRSHYSLEIYIDKSNSSSTPRHSNTFVHLSKPYIHQNVCIQDILILIVWVQGCVGEGSNCSTKGYNNGGFVGFVSLCCRREIAVKCRSFCIMNLGVFVEHVKLA